MKRLKTLKLARFVTVTTKTASHDDSPPRDLFGIFCIREAVRDGLSKNAAEFCPRSRV